MAVLKIGGSFYYVWSVTTSEEVDGETYYYNAVMDESLTNSGYESFENYPFGIGGALISSG